MTVGELKEMLKDEPDDYLVVLSKDSEGNRFSPLYIPSTGMYEPETEWSGDVIDQEWAEEEGGTEYKENAVILWPMN